MSRPATPAPVAIEEPRRVRRKRVERAEPYVRPVGASPATQTLSGPEPQRTFPFPGLAALQAVLVVGAVVGLVGVLLTYASLKFCELVGGTDSCGGPGLLLLAATLVLMTYVGGWLLRGFDVADPVSTSFLAVALLAVMTMVFFLGVIYSWWLVLVIPPVSMALYALSWWVTTTLVEDDDSSPAAFTR